MPALEAMTVGVPVVAANRRRACPKSSATPARLFDPRSPAELAAHLRDLLADAVAARNGMRDAGWTQAARFSWARHGAARVREAWARSRRAPPATPWLIGRCTSASTAASSSASRPASAATSCRCFADVGGRSGLGLTGYTIFLPADAPASVTALGERFAGRTSSRRRKRGHDLGTDAARAGRRRGTPDVFFARRLHGAVAAAVPVGRRHLRRVVFRAPGMVWPARTAATALADEGGGRSARGVSSRSPNSPRDEIVRYLDVPRGKIVVAPPGARRRSSTTSAGAARSADRALRRVAVQSPADSRTSAGVRAGGARGPGRAAGADRRQPHASADRSAGAGVRARHRRPRRLARIRGRRRSSTRRTTSARVFVFLSDYEGFAMTPLEALAHGVPAMLLDTPIAREVYGDAARLVRTDPADDRRRADRRCSPTTRRTPSFWRAAAPRLSDLLLDTIGGHRSRSARTGGRRVKLDGPRRHHRQLQHARRIC